ncbi:interferon-induced 35 kDa protein homolog isoform X1 [Cottoperca gobio]|uniref:Interferon-induced 35 kDa protein homolog isoform X1 n=2 Tax=Cottoperca gobio TaxID=56716 RepID=A0A6J2Q5J6_COTGO|nr:interferon-induced 35 kDa protein homolog isoform X1 [Cottoperca gobio]
MSSDEDFSMVLPGAQPSEETLEGIMVLINDYKKKYEQLIQEQEDMVTSRVGQREMTEKFKQRTVKLTQSLKEDQRLHQEKIGIEKAKVKLMKDEECKLMKDILKVEEALKEEESENKHLTQQTEVFTAVPERKVVFKGSTGKGVDSQTFDMKPHIVYPMEDGTALITFADEVVATKILELEKHQVDLGAEFSITVEARPVRLMLPSLVEIDSEVSPLHILVSNLPKMDIEMLLSRLENHFSKTKHGGGEVDDCEWLPDSGTVVIAFVKNNFARGLTNTEYHDVKLQHNKQKMDRVRVTPFLNGKITNLKTKMLTCPRTVLLTGIPTIMERENLQDLLEIYFQKMSNGGGEIEAILYNPLGQHTSALFEGVSTDEEQE